MSWTDPPPQPMLYLNGTKDAHWAKGLLKKYAIDFEERHTPDPFVVAGDENARPNRGR